MCTVDTWLLVSWTWYVLADMVQTASPALRMRSSSVSTHDLLFSSLLHASTRADRTRLASMAAELRYNYVVKSISFATVSQSEITGIFPSEV